MSLPSTLTAQKSMKMIFSADKIYYNLFHENPKITNLCKIPTDVIITLVKFQKTLHNFAISIKLKNNAVYCIFCILCSPSCSTITNYMKLSINSCKMNVNFKHKARTHNKVFLDKFLGSFTCSCVQWTSFFPQLFLDKFCLIVCTA